MSFVTTRRRNLSFAFCAKVLLSFYWGLLVVLVYIKQLFIRSIENILYPCCLWFFRFEFSQLMFFRRDDFGVWLTGSWGDHLFWGDHYLFRGNHLGCDRFRFLYVSFWLWLGLGYLFGNSRLMLLDTELRCVHGNDLRYSGRSDGWVILQGRL
uniref:Transmembrane protein n=1 Tax=Pyramimonas obovata TaxID=1411642 RepID=A0A7S0R8M0_9CHLO|mmetsp:Transcript_28084/g.61479  ORF Transcript_28084/g.61479 Transcript_28084/m.61479 type:complete len:153 (+) Transcript_28084:882-1340(+)